MYEWFVCTVSNKVINVHIVSPTSDTNVSYFLFLSFTFQLHDHFAVLLALVSMNAISKYR